MPTGGRWYSRTRSFRSRTCGPKARATPKPGASSPSTPAKSPNSRASFPRMNLPEDLKYTAEHEWVRVTGDVARIGITDFAQDSLGDVVFVQLPDAGTDVVAGASISEIESTKSVSDVYAPLTGLVLAVND